MLQPLVRVCRKRSCIESCRVLVEGVPLPLLLAIDVVEWKVGLDFRIKKAFVAHVAKVHVGNGGFGGEGWRDDCGAVGVVGEGGGEKGGVRT